MSPTTYNDALPFSYKMFLYERHYTREGKRRTFQLQLSEFPTYPYDAFAYLLHSFLRVK
jgi:hypothetical protein